jgi:hypothetical protein
MKTYALFFSFYRHCWFGRSLTVVHIDIRSLLYFTLIHNHAPSLLRRARGIHGWEGMGGEFVG